MTTESTTSIPSSCSPPVRYDGVQEAWHQTVAEADFTTFASEAEGGDILGGLPTSLELSSLYHSTCGRPQEQAVVRLPEVAASRSLSAGGIAGQGLPCWCLVFLSWDGIIGQGRE